MAGVESQTTLYRDEPHPNYGDVLPALCGSRVPNAQEMQEAVTKKILRSFPVRKVIEPVFPDQEVNTRFSQALSSIAKEPDTTLEMGGREMRKMIGCVTDDWSDTIKSHIKHDLSEHDKIRLGIPVLERLAEYPAERTRQPDLDFFVNGASLESVQRHLSDQGLESEIHHATGGVDILEVKTDHGTATFIKSGDSWQTQNRYPWPQYCFRAKLNTDQKGESVFDVNISQARMSIYPLDLAGLQDAKYPVDSPYRVAVVGRTLLLALTATDPNHMPLKLPGDNTQTEILKTVAELPKIFAMNEEERRQYGSGIRDNALALLIIISNNYTTVANDLSMLDQSTPNPNLKTLTQQSNFFSHVLGRYVQSRFDSLAA